MPEQESRQVEATSPYPDCILAGVDLILSHFGPPIFPRTISTHATKGAQFSVYSKEQMLKHLKQSDFVDSKVNAYPLYVEYKGINRQAPDLIFIDLDRSTFLSERAHKMALSATLKNIRERLSGHPSVLWSGNGYHVIQPIEAVVLESIDQFATFECPSLQFLRFAEGYLSNGRSDPSHHPSFKSCLLRIPGSHNSKCVLSGKDAGVKVIQRWNGFRPDIRLLLGTFYSHLISMRMKENNDADNKRARWRYDQDHCLSKARRSCIEWIDMLLQTPVADGRKLAVDLVLAPYLITVKQLPQEASYGIIKSWLVKCNELKKLDFSIDSRVTYSLGVAIRKGIPPMRLNKLKERNSGLYDKIRAAYKRQQKPFPV